MGERSAPADAVKAMFTTLCRDGERPCCYGACMPMTDPSRARLAHPFLAGSAALSDAAQLQREFGDDAGQAAQLRAAHARARDNALRYCHWREVERMLAWLDAPAGGATRH